MNSCTVCIQREQSLYSTRAGACNGLWYCWRFRIFLRYVYKYTAASTAVVTRNSKEGGVAAMTGSAPIDTALCGDSHYLYDLNSAGGFISAFLVSPSLGTLSPL